MEIKVSTSLETALEFISEVATCKEEELEEKSTLTYSFINSLDEVISETLLERLRVMYADVRDIRKIIKGKKRIGE